MKLNRVIAFCGLHAHAHPAVTYVKSVCKLFIQCKISGKSAFNLSEIILVAAKFFTFIYLLFLFYFIFSLMHACQTKQHWQILENNNTNNVHHQEQKWQNSRV